MKLFPFLCLGVALLIHEGKSKAAVESETSKTNIKNGPDSGKCGSGCGCNSGCGCCNTKSGRYSIVPIQMNGSPCGCSPAGGCVGLPPCLCGGVYHPGFGCGCGGCGCNTPCAGNNCCCGCPSIIILEEGEIAMTG